MCGFDHTTILSPSFHSLCKERLAQWPAFCVLKTNKNSAGYYQKNWEGVCGTLPETITLIQTKICDFLYPISDLIKNLIPNFRPEALEPGVWPERMTSCYRTYTVVGLNIIRETVLSPNDEEVANSSKKTYPFLDKSAQTIPYFRPKWSKLTPYVVAFKEEINTDYLVKKITRSSAGRRGLYTG